MVPKPDTHPAGSGPANHPDDSAGATWLSVAAAAVPPAVAGCLVGLLLVYLNPSAVGGPLGLGRLAATYGALGVAAGVLLVMPFLWRNLRRAASAFPWLMTAVLVSGAVLYAMHASRWSFYLPAVANRRLLYAAAILFGLGLLAFYTALLHAVNRRPYSYRSIGLVTASGCIAVLLLGFMRPPAPAPDPGASTPQPLVSKPRPVVLIGLDGATLEVVLPLAQQGALPLLGSWIDSGVVAPVETLKPPRQVALWTSVSTGTWPFHHRVPGERRYRPPGSPEAALRLLPEGLGFARWGLLDDPGRPIEEADLGRKPLWAVYRDLGFTATVVGWPPHARRAAEGEELTAASDLATLTAEADLTLVRVADLAAASKAGLGAWIRTRRGERGERIERSARQLEEAYREVDRALASWQASLPKDCVIAVISPHGYGQLPRWRELLAAFTGAAPGQGTARGGQDGVLILRGPGIRSGERLPPVRLVDVMPTLAHAAGLPVAADLDGDVLTRAFAAEGLADRPLTFVPSYETWLPSSADSVTSPSSSRAAGRTDG